MREVVDCFSIGWSPFFFCMFQCSNMSISGQPTQLVFNSSNYPVNNSLMIGDYVTPINNPIIPTQTFRQWWFMEPENQYYATKIVDIAIASFATFGLLSFIGGYYVHYLGLYQFCRCSIYWCSDEVINMCT